MIDDDQYNGRITILISERGSTIEILDQLSRAIVCEVTLTPEQTCQALGRLAYTPCDIKYGELSRVGKKQEYKKWSFEIPSECYYNYTGRKELAYKIAKNICPDGWEPDLYFGSQDSFFTKGEKQYAQTIIRRWIPNEKTSH